jgi:polyhydroxyalkanoate synthase
MYKIHLMVSGDVTFVLTVGGHNAGIVSEPGHKGRSYHMHERKVEDPYVSPERWQAEAEKHEGSWWTAWHTWLQQHSADEKVPPLALKNTLGAAPGTYVFQK